MENRKKERTGGKGRLPAMAPLANPYVPFQLEEPPMYESRKGLVRGTLYPGLDLPFKGMVNRKERNITPKTELQALAFAVNELALYLDTHRDDARALELYREYQKLYHQCRHEYADNCGPMSHRTPTEGPYRWLDDPWPWEYCANKEA